MNSVLFVRCFLYDFFRNREESRTAAYRRFNSLQTRAEERSQGTIEQGGPKSRFDDIYITKKISYFLRRIKKE